MAIGDPTIHSTLGFLFESILISTALYGAGCLQGWFYFRKNCRGDSWAIKGTVLLVLFCDTAQMALLCVMLYKYTITHFADPAALSKMEKSVLLESFFGGVIAFAVQHFYCWRIWLLTRSYLVTGFISLLSIASLVTHYIYSGTAMGYETLEDLLRLSKLATAVNSLGAITDVLISGVIIFMLRGQKTPFRKTSDMVNRMIFFTFNSGLPTSICALLNVITLNVIPQTFAYIAFFFLLGKFYTNSLLVTLNSREYIRYGRDGQMGSEGISMPSIIVRTGDQNAENNTPTHTISIRIDESIMTPGDAKFEKHPGMANESLKGG